MGTGTRRILVALALSIAIPAHAVGRWTDATDLWWLLGQSNFDDDPASYSAPI